MKCNTVRTKLAGYLDDAITGGARVEERVQIRQHLEGCSVCREELERFRKLAVIVDAQGHMTDYQIISGPTSLELRRQLDQMLLFSRFSPMLSFGRPTPGGHVVLGFSAVRVRG